MSLRTHPDDLHAMDNGARSPEIHHPRPTRPPQLQRRVTISTDADEEQESPTWRHYAPANAAPSTEKVAQSTEIQPGQATGNKIQRSPSAPPALNHPPPTLTTIHPILAVRSILRAHARMRLAWDVRFSPDVPSISARMHSNHRHSTSAISTIPATTSTTTPGRPRANTQPQADLAPDLELASGLNARLNHNYNSIAAAPATGPGTGTMTGAFANHPLALEPATTPPRARMLIVCRDLLPWLIPVYARDSEAGCTVLDVVRGIYNALQVSVEVSGQTRSDGETPARVERRRVEWLREKTLFVCLGRDEALARRRLPGRENVWSEVFVLTLARREQR